MKRPTADRLRDIIDAIERTRRLRPTSQAAFEADEIKQLGLLKLVEIVGEASNHVDEAVRKKHPEVPWREIIAMRHRTVHGYFEVDTDVLWFVVTESLPPLLPQVRAILEEIERAEQ